MRFATLRNRLLVVLMLLATGPVHAELVLSSAPRDSKEIEEALFRPVAELLSRVSGEKVRFQHGGNFLIYQSEMRKGTYDITLDGPAFVGWRMAKLGHTPLVKFPGNLVFVAIAKKNDNRIKELKDLAGRTLCAFPSPNLATLTVLYEFDNPARQPLVVETDSFPASYKNLLAGKCVGGIMQAKLYQEMDKDAQAAKILFTSKPLPNQAFTASPRIKPEVREKMVQALLSPEGMATTKALLEVYKVPALQPASVEEYNGLGVLLRDVWGFELN